MIQFSLALSAPNASIAAIDYVLFTVLAADGGDGKLNLVIHDGQNGKAVPDADEDKTGAVTVANLNDTDADKTVDAQDDDVREMRTGDNKHGRNELDLMKLLVHKPKGYAGGDVKLTVTPKERVMLWTNSWKETPLAEYDPDTGVATFSSWGANEKSKTVWVEVKSKSDTVADISLELTYDTFVPDKVVATGVWMTKTDAIFATKSWDELEDSVWRTDLDERLQTDVKLNGGTGINPFVSFFTDATKARIQNRMIMQFTVSPVDVETELSRVKFDISRQKQGKSWDNVGTDPHLTEEKDWKLQWEEADDDSNNSDESFKVNGSGRMYSTDGPGFRALPIVAIPEEPSPSKGWQERNFWEFGRVTFDGTRARGNGVKGSQVSGNYAWHSLLSMRWDAETKKWRRSAAGEAGANSLAGTHVTIGTEPTGS